MFRRIKTHFAQSIKSAATNATTTTYEQPIAKSEEPYFKRKWDIDDNGFASLRLNPGRTMTIREIETIIKECIEGVTREPHRDSSGHRRYWKHPVQPVAGFKYKGERYPLVLTNGVDSKNTLSIRHELDNGRSDKLADINLFDYVIFDKYKPVIDTQGLASEIWRAMNHEARKNN